ncbi:hypothetical protein CPC08DRAFT_594274, partial [Agrocybe pediades]
LMFVYNVQHDCRKARCEASGTRSKVQERVASETLIEFFIEHKPLDRYLINTYAFHNAHLIRQILPHHLTAPISYSTDRKLDHSQASQKLRHMQEGK